jgi:hypothetical protein
MSTTELIINLVIAVISLGVGHFSGWHWHRRPTKNSEQQLQDLKDYIAPLLQQDDVRVQRSEAGEINDVQIIRPEGVPSEEAFGEATVVSLGPPPRGVELESVLGGRGGPSGDLTVGRRPWWRRLFGGRNA